MPKGEKPLSAADCYRYVLSNPKVDVSMMGIKNSGQLRENISIMEMGELSEGEKSRIERIGEYVYSN
jgi:predicted aldo/keto reductase-like oxidoreductase